MERKKINNVLFYIVFFALIAWLLFSYYNEMVKQGRAESIETLRKKIENRINIDSINKSIINDTIAND